MAPRAVIAAGALTQAFGWALAISEAASDAASAFVVADDPAWCSSVPTNRRAAAGCTGSGLNSPVPSWCTEVPASKKADTGCLPAGQEAPSLLELNTPPSAAMMKAWNLISVGQDPAWCYSVAPGQRKAVGCTAGNSANAPNPAWCLQVPTGAKKSAGCSFMEESASLTDEDPAWCSSVPTNRREAAGCTGSGMNQPPPSWCDQVPAGQKEVAGCVAKGQASPSLLEVKTNTLPSASEMKDWMLTAIGQDPAWCYSVAPGARKTAGCTAGNSANAPDPAWCLQVPTGQKKNVGCSGLVAKSATISDSSATKDSA